MIAGTLPQRFETLLWGRAFNEVSLKEPIMADKVENSNTDVTKRYKLIAGHHQDETGDYNEGDIIVTNKDLVKSLGKNKVQLLGLATDADK